MIEYARLGLKMKAAYMAAIFVVFFEVTRRNLMRVKLPILISRLPAKALASLKRDISPSIFNLIFNHDLIFFLKGGEIMKKAIVINGLILTALIFASPVFADDPDVSKIQSFIQSIIQVLVTLAGLVSAGFFVWGGFGYVTSSGNPESLERSKRTILYSGLGLAIILGAFVLSNIVTQLATSAFK
ncbi:MAG: TrbC/VirB2 family protein [Patescibacteria group bacterium]|nr:TrbC/VirB2 family protein [Patescibacteria group bacterium]